VKTSITIVESIATEAPASLAVMDRREIRETPGINLDDRLRNVPGFSLFRRSSSVVAHPTTQGVSLRGIGSSGASRSLVLWDGVPVNDPFGGWVYWTRFPSEQLGRVEISRGASTSIFGDRAMGGAIAVFSREPERHRLEGSYEGGNQNTHDAAAGYSNLWTRWAVSAVGRALSTDGYYIVPERVRGDVDRRAAVRFVTGTARVDYFGGPQSLFFKADMLAEERRNGTVLQNNSTGLGAVALHYQREIAGDSLSVLGFHTRGTFRSTFSAIAAGRDSERPTFRQRVPSEGTGAAGLWQHKGSGWSLLGGGDAHRVEGFSTDFLFPAGTRVGGGDMLQHGLFVQGDWSTGPARLFGGVRHSFTGQGHRFFSPSAGAAVGRGRLRARGSVYRSFRAPTLNELFREFRVGNAVTQANAALRPETLLGAEAGVDWIGESGAVRLTLYRNSLEDLITNVTLSTSPNLIVRQRRNAAEALSRGFELEGRQSWRGWRGEAAYLYVDSRFEGGARVPQIPRHQGSAQLSYARGGTLASLGVRSYAAQFEDELNRFLLPGFAAVQFMVQQRVARGLAATLAVENLFDREYLTGFSPTPTIGAPRLWRAGLRWEGRIR
jgi:outer membrane receptor protein involved in Fe transport